MRYSINVHVQYSAGAAACTKKSEFTSCMSSSDRERARAEVYPVYDHYQMYMYHRHKQGKAQIVHMGNTKISQLVYRFKTSNCHYRNLRVEYYQYTYSLVQELNFFGKKKLVIYLSITFN